MVQEHVEGLGQILLLVRAKEDTHDGRRQDKRKTKGKHEQEEKKGQDEKNNVEDENME